MLYHDREMFLLSFIISRFAADIITGYITHLPQIDVKAASFLTARRLLRDSNHHRKRGSLIEILIN